MDFMNRNDQQQPSRVAPLGSAPHPVPPTNTPDNMSTRRASGLPSWVRVARVILLFSVTILTLAVATFLYSFNPNESKYVATDKYQAIFLANGQVYFGKLRVVTAK